MQENRLAKRYARGLVQALNGDEAAFERVCRELADFAGLLAGHHQLKLAMETAIVSVPHKLDILEALAEKQNFHALTRAFLRTMAEENRLAILEPIRSQAQREWEEALHIERLRVFSAVPLEAGQRRRLALNLQRVFAKTIILEEQVDAALLAGIKLVRGSVVYDFSLQGNLERLKESLTEELACASTSTKSAN